MLQDKDLLSIQNARDLVNKAQIAQQEYKLLSQEQIDNVIKNISFKLRNYAEELARMAVDETGFGKYEDKIIKNLFASVTIFEYIQNQKIVGILDDDKDNKVISIGVPVGVISGLVPSTNPTSTAIYKSLIALKSGNAIVLSPHPSALKCITRTVELIKQAIFESGQNPDLVSVLAIPTLQSTTEIMKISNLILATGGPDMVKAAYSSGTPALGVGPGNVPAFIEKTADIAHAVKCIITSKTFDNGTVCASEQMIVVEKSIADKVEAELKKHNAYFLNPDEQKKVESIILTPTKRLNAKIVGQTAQKIAQMAGISVPSNIKVLVGRCSGVGKDHPFSVEKLSPLLGFYVEQDWESACAKCIEILTFEGMGHSLAIHTKNENIVKEFALCQPVSRILINTPSTHGGIGATTNIAPALTLGCGSVGGSSISDNIEPKHLINIRRAAYGVLEPEQLTFDQRHTSSVINEQSHTIDIEKITKLVIEKLNIQ
ncbi:MAG: acetaldehyde dehydrogenase (acetylating) [Brevinemataceae bacterium]